MIDGLLPTVCGFAAGTDRISSEKSSTVDALFRMLAELGATVGWEKISSRIGVVLPAFEYVFTNDGASSAAKVRTLVFVQQLAEHSTSLQGAQDLVPVLVQAVPQGFNVSRTALEACGSIARFVVGSVSQELFNTVHEMFMRDSLDGDIKHAAIVAMGNVLVTCDLDEQALGTAQDRLATQLNNEITRTGAVMVIGMLAKAGFDISAVLGSCLQKVVDLTRQADGHIRHQALHSLREIAASASVSASLSSTQVDIIMQGLADKIPSTELKDIELALHATSALVNSLGAGCANTSQEMLLGSVCSCLMNDSFQVTCQKPMEF